jgi:hypothetical protein
MYLTVEQKGPNPLLALGTCYLWKTNEVNSDKLSKME